MIFCHIKDAHSRDESCFKGMMDNVTQLSHNMSVTKLLIFCCIDKGSDYSYFPSWCVSDFGRDMDMTQLKSTLTCKICLTDLISIIFVPCGHLGE